MHALARATRVAHARARACAHTPHPLTSAALPPPPRPVTAGIFWGGSLRDADLLAAATAVANFANDDPGTDSVRPEKTFWWEVRALKFDEKKWRQHFHVSKSVFNFELDEIVSHDVFRVAGNMTRPVPVEKQVAVFLYRVCKVHPGVASIADKFAMSSSTVVACTERVACAIIDLVRQRGRCLRAGPARHAQP